MFKSISHRIFFAFGCLTAVICILFALITWLFAAVTEDDVIKQVMHVEAQFIKDSYSLNESLFLPRVDYIQLYRNPSEMPEDIRHKVTANRYEKEFSIDNRNVHFDQFLLLDGEQFWLLIDGTGIHVLDKVTGLMLWFLLGVTLVIMTIAIYIAWLISIKTAQPLVNLTETVAHHKPGQVFIEPGANRSDEIGALSRSFNTAFGNISDLLIREKNFTNDVSHELRTPITVLTNTLALAEGQPINENEKLVLNEVAKDLKSTVEILLALARTENFTFDTLSVIPLLEKSVLILHQSNPEITFRVRLEVDPQMKITGNAYLVSLLFQNLVNNGFYHGSDGDMTILNQGHAIIFKNKLNQNHTSAYRGLGHGQNLVQRIALVMNWQVNVHKGNDLYQVEVVTGPL